MAHDKIEGIEDSIYDIRKELNAIYILLSGELSDMNTNLKRIADALEENE